MSVQQGSGVQQVLRSEPACGRVVAWRSLGGGVWVARREGRHLGLVERGRRFIAVGPDSEPLGAFRSLAEAQAAVVAPGSAGAVVEGGSVSGGLLVGAVGLVAAAMLALWPALLLVLPGTASR